MRSDLKILKRYSGESVDELLALESTHRYHTIVMAIHDAVCLKAQREGEQSLSIEEWTVRAIESFEVCVGFEGFRYFFSVAPELAPGIVSALRRIGCPETADICKDAIAALGLPIISVRGIRTVLRRNDQARARILNRCDSQFLKYPEPVTARHFAYIKANKSSIRL